ncbi:MAG: BrnT family toxin [Reyranella sp.]
MFTWHAAKAARNLAKHGVSFESALDFDWATSVVVDRTRRSDGERRQAAIGWLGNRLHTVIFTDRADGVRLISFRRANRAEARTYEAISSGKN